ncbi:VOC family protein [Sphingomonas tabacisoli]|uniref:VOC family protein n=1 Tax=Sphingomonas tabacisoli TaxID=2249466 RepID=A0ABW4I2X4_9SPHN
MAITGIRSLVYSVGDVATSARFFEDFGLRPLGGGEVRRFDLPEGSEVVIRHRDDPELPASSLVGDGVREVVWGVDTQASLDALAADIGRDRGIVRSPDGVIRFLTDFGIAMGLTLFTRKTVVCAPDQVNAPGHVRRLNQHRKWRLRAHPKGIAHVVFAIPDFENGYAFMRDRLGFRLSDDQRGFGMYLRADGTNNHHNLLLLNASAPFPGMDGRHRFHHANFALEDIDEIMIGANHMVRQGWEASAQGLGRHRIDSALFYYLPCPAGGEAEYGADADYVDDSWVPRAWTTPLFAYSHFVHNLPPFLREPPAWDFHYITGIEPAKGHH